MRDAYDLLKEKEAHLARVRREVDSLRIVSGLLGEDADVAGVSKPPSSAAHGDSAETESEATGTDGSLFSTAAPRSTFWNKLKR